MPGRRRRGGAVGRARLSPSPPAPLPPAAGETGANRILYGPWGLRSGWRILLWLVLMLAFAFPLTPLALAVLGRSLIAGFVPMLVASVAAGMVMLRVVDRRPAGALGFAWEPAAVRDNLLGFGLGGGILGAVVLLMAVTGGARWLADTGTVPEYAAALALSLAQFAIAAAAEEAVFRGYGFQALVQGIGAWPAVAASSAFFAWVHAENPNANPLGLANIFLAGVMLAVVYLRTRSLWAATAVHLGWNWVMSALLDFPVSGLQLDTPLYDVRETGADWWTGGAFGPEAGLAATLVLLAATVWLWRTPLLGESEQMRVSRPLVDGILTG